MLESISNRPAPDWANNLRRGDIVLFRFPCAEENSSEAPKSRTCLVLEVEMREDQLWIKVAYGTSAPTRANIGSEIHIDTPEDIAAAGVRKSTRIVCDRRIWATPSHSGWDVNPLHPSPVVGHLSPGGIARMNAIRTSFKALRDAAAERRSARGKLFRVEHRRSRALAPLSRGARR